LFDWETENNSFYPIGVPHAIAVPERMVNLENSGLRPVITELIITNKVQK